MTLRLLPRATRALAALWLFAAAAEPADACGPSWEPPIAVFDGFPYRVPQPGERRGHRERTLWAVANARLSLPEPENAWDAHRRAWERYQSRAQALESASGTSIAPYRSLKRYHYGGYDPCRTNALPAVESFLDALEASPSLPAKRRAELLSLRHQMANESCGSQDAGAALAARLREAKTGADPETREFVTYLAGAHAFYTADYAVAEAEFRSLAGSEHPWLVDAGPYMLARTQLVAAQVKWPFRYRDPEAVQAENERLRNEGLRAAREAFEDYLERRPEGRYAHSARGLRRFLHRRLAEEDELIGELAALYGQLRRAAVPASERRDRVQEILRYYRAPEAIPYETPFLLLTSLLKDAEPERYSLASLGRRRAAYEATPGLLDYAQALLLHLSERTESVAALPAAELGDGVFAIAATSLRARALEKLERFAEASALWRSLLPGAERPDVRLFLQVRLVDNALRRGDRLQPFANGEVSLDPELAKRLFLAVLSRAELESLLERSPTPDALRELAQHALLHRLFVEGHFADFLEVYARTADPGHFAEVETAARSLAADPADAKGLLNAGYFLQLRRISPDVWVPDSLREHLRPIPDPRQPFDYYEAVIEARRDATPSEVEAKALHYAIRCFAPGFRGDGCIWRGLEEERRKSAEWFARLHRKYAGSKWAERTPYYY
ncbi:MAG: hypothetical protein MJE66_18665 [Proteobacteria bacterium]|nr:hypothetical protein [Pseudomonadota bacterium]